MLAAWDVTTCRVYVYLASQAFDIWGIERAERCKGFSFWYFGHVPIFPFVRFWSFLRFFKFLLFLRFWPFLRFLVVSRFAIEILVVFGIFKVFAIFEIFFCPRQKDQLGIMNSLAYLQKLHMTCPMVSGHFYFFGKQKYVIIIC